MTEQRQKYTSVLSIRLTKEERVRLDRDAGDLTFSAYGRSKLFGDNVTPRKTRGKRPVKDHIALAQIFGMLKQTSLFNNVNQIAKSIHMGTADFSEETEILLQQACKAIIEMRNVLIKALGLKS